MDPNQLAALMAQMGGGNNGSVPGNGMPSPQAPPAPQAGGNPLAGLPPQLIQMLLQLLMGQMGQGQGVPPPGMVPPGAGGR